MAYGTLTVYASLAGQAAPLPGVRLEVLDGSGALLARACTDGNGAAQVPDLPAPDARYSLEEANDTVRPYAVYRLTARADGWQAQILDGVQVFAGQQTVARLAFLPAEPAAEGAAPRDGLDSAVYTHIPPHPLYAGDGGSGAPPQEAASPFVLDEVVIPEKITVHLGKPSANVRNVTVPFQDYIANVASSEVYPTWEGYRNSQTRPAFMGPKWFRAAGCPPLPPGPCWHSRPA